MAVKRRKNNSISKTERQAINKEQRIKRRIAVLGILGNKCTMCGFNDPRALQIDHINGGGHKERREIKGTYSYHVIESVLNKENKYQLLCANCNWIKRYNNNEHR